MLRPNGSYKKLLFSWKASRLASFKAAFKFLPLLRLTSPQIEVRLESCAELDRPARLSCQPRSHRALLSFFHFKQPDMRPAGVTAQILSAGTMPASERGDKRLHCLQVSQRSLSTTQLRPDGGNCCVAAHTPIPSDTTITAEPKSALGSKWSTQTIRVIQSQLLVPMATATAGVIVRKVVFLITCHMWSLVLHQPSPALILPAPPAVNRLRTSVQFYFPSTVILTSIHLLISLCGWSFVQWGEKQSKSGFIYWLAASTNTKQHDWNSVYWHQASCPPHQNKSI